MGAFAIGAIRAARKGRRRPTSYRRRLPAADGFTLIEVMVTIVLLSIGLLGLAGLQSRTAVMEMESYQRTQALILAQDMADRIHANKAHAARYVGDGYGLGAEAGCAGSLGVQFDLCAWGNAIRGTAEKSGALNVGTLLGGRGCIGAATASQYQVVVVWQGLIPSAAPAVRCGQGSYGADAYRRAVVVPVGLASLQGI